MPVTLTLRRLRQEEHEFKANLSYVMKSCPFNCINYLSLCVWRFACIYAYGGQKRASDAGDWSYRQ